VVNAAIISLAVVLATALVSAVGLFWVDQPAAGWAALVVGLLGALSLLCMVATTARVRED
jgi:hypothetical protein